MKQVAEEKRGDIPFRASIARKGTLLFHKGTVFQIADLVFVITKREAAHAAMVLSGKRKCCSSNLMIRGGGQVGEMVAHNMKQGLKRFA